MAHYLIIDARFYPEIADELCAGAIAEIESAGASHERISVPGVLEMPTALAISYDADGENGKKYDGFIMLGCVIRGETSHYDIVAIESARAIMDFSVANRVPVGNGILTVENRRQAEVRAAVDEKNKGRDAARAVIALGALKQQMASKA
ncbi:MAG: 6,7-dimethyl-8-ribityllumazine synthase [Rhizobiales bacterium]|nr:6,7-dimethyl-8-ribityllumazine synthase [Hyphomicrobiales bacterium]